MTLLDAGKNLKKTPLFDRHAALGGKMIDFGGWSLPVYYSSIMEEHKWTRESCGFFDVSHLGELRVSGPGALDHLQKRLTSDISKALPGKVVYAVICDEKGYALDDILVYGAPAEYYIIVNAANIERDFLEFKKYAPADVLIEDFSEHMACVAVQGPKSQAILEKLFGFKLTDMAYYTHIEQTFEGDSVWISRSGYTGEDGFEIFSANEKVSAIWDKLVKEGKALGALPCGLGARNTLRLEAGNPLYGHELDERTTPLDAGMKFVVNFDKGDFVGREALLAQKEAGTKKALVAFKMLDRSVPRDGYPVFYNGKNAGSVTSGSFAPTVGAGIGLAFVSPQALPAGTKIQIEIHGRMADAEIVKRPFVQLKHRKQQG
jgi:aminomethyltransferase